MIEGELVIVVDGKEHVLGRTQMHDLDPEPFERERPLITRMSLTIAADARSAIALANLVKDVDRQVYGRGPRDRWGKPR